ncbi:serine metalloprotease [Caballeronia calidae]|uniref:Serine metalloprotease n=1 Tax=Caballeronia calidae TaxID=1777139 RepID=A0A158EAP9_9BURK|nr:S8 family peptidase [Caballeronia calidae]SAL03800.1 serine metalloprotease [Caballeronia calidae]
MRIKLACLSVIAVSVLGACGGGTGSSIAPQSTVKVQNSASQLKSTAKAAANEIPAGYASRTSVSGILEDGQYDRFIVYYRKSNLLKGSSNDTAAAASNNSRVASARGISIQERSITGTRGHVIQTSKGMSASEAQAFMVEYLKNPDVEYIEPDLIVHPALVPNDAQYGQQWGMSGEATGISLPAAWDKATGKGVVVAVVDTGITEHSDLAGQVLPGYNFISNATFDRNRSGRSADASDPGDWLQIGDSCPASGGPYYVHDSTWHGTHVAGIIAAKTNNGVGVAGTAFNSKILPARALGRCGGFTSDINDAIVWASGGSVPGVPDNPNPAKVINLSISGNGQCSKTNQDAIDIARSNGAIIVQAAGNDSIDASQTYSTPACQGIIVVGATNSSGNRAWFSNFGSLVNVMAPGDTILSTVNAGAKGPEGEGYGYMSGTSQATPHAAGVVALLLEQQPSSTVDQIRSYLASTATSMSDRCPEGCGAGLINADKALASLPLPVDGDLPVTGEVNVKADAANGATYKVPALDNLQLLRLDVSAASKARIRSQFDQTWTDCRIGDFGVYNCMVWDPKPGFYYVNIVSSNGTDADVNVRPYINGGHVKYGETVELTSKAPYFLPIVVNLDPVSATEAPYHTIAIHNRVYVMVTQYSGGGRLFEFGGAELYNENMWGSGGSYGGAWMLIGPYGSEDPYGTGEGQAKPTDNAPIFLILDLGSDDGKEVKATYTAKKAPR